MLHVEFETLDELETHLDAGRPLEHAVFQSLDLTSHVERLRERSLHGAVLLGCQMPPDLVQHAVNSGALLFPRIDGVPYNPYRAHLYTPEALLGAYRPGEPDSYHATLDGRVYHYFMDRGGPEPTNFLDLLAQRLHDQAITDALHEFIDGRRVVAIMGGHGMARDADAYHTVARIARQLTRRGFLLASGGGPGAMEATHLGAWFAHHSEDALREAADMLAVAPRYTPVGAWLDAAFAVRDAFPRPDGAPPSLGIPTWHYGHEPPNVFATHIAKYFTNSLREDGLLAIARHGVIFAPGSAGTIQEVFQDAAQNHYETMGHVSPMIFFGTDYWTREKPVYPLLRQLAEGHTYASFLHLSDDIADIVSTVERFATKLDELP
jgi:predicted Rossmann-fold nucleotide-binding protein